MENRWEIFNVYLIGVLEGVKEWGISNVWRVNSW